MVVDHCKDERPAMTFDIEIDRELDGRWIAEVPDLAGVMTYGATREEAVAHVQALALRVMGLPGKHGLFSPARVFLWKYASRRPRRPRSRSSTRRSPRA